MSDTETVTVFLSYATPDRERVLPFYDHLAAQGYKPWMDCKELLPGQHWEFEVRKAIDAATMIVMFVSANSVDRTGYVQKELRLALGKLEERPLHHIYIVPVILDRGIEPPTQLGELHRLYADQPDACAQLSKAVAHQLQRASAARAESKRTLEMDWSFGRIQDAWDGLPGYDIDISWPIFSSRRFPQIAQAGEIIKGRLLSAAAHERMAKLSQSPEAFSYGQSRFFRTNLYHVECHDPTLQGSVLSQHATIHWYGAGAAHPNQNFRTWVFMLDPLVPVESLVDCFSSPAMALRELQVAIRQQLIHALRKSRRSLGQETEFPVDEEWVTRGTADWDDLLAFTFENDGLAIAFPPYQVASYADGPQFVRVPYEQFAHMLSRTYVDALGLTHLVKDASSAPPVA